MPKRKLRKRRSPPAKIVQIEAPVTDQHVLGLRFRFKQLKANALYNASEAEWMAEVTKLAGSQPTPEKWVEAAEKATTKCDRCHNGVYSWGACVNGSMQHSAPCFRCQGKGRQNQADYTRNIAYDRHRKV